jgi:CMP-N-acetylneuraminic acid synthetase
VNQASTDTTEFLLGLVPARAGSKRVPDKNIRAFAGRSLLDLAVRAAIDAQGINEIALSTDSPDYVALVAAAGHREAYRRPVEVSGDDATSLDTVIDYLNWRNKQGLRQPSHLVLLQPTSPFRTAEMIDNAITAWRRSGKPSLVSATPAAPNSTYLVHRDQSGADGTLEIGDQARETYVLDGSLYITPYDMVMAENRFWNEHSEIFVIHYPRPYDIDSETDFRAAETLALADLNYANFMTGDVA